jgi:hypothetical protein
MHQTITQAIVTEHIADRIGTAERDRLARSVRRPRRRLRLVLRRPSPRPPVVPAPR